MNLNTIRISYTVYFILFILSVVTGTFASVTPPLRQTGAMIMLPLADYELEQIQELNSLNDTPKISKTTANQMEVEGIAMPSTAPHLSIMAVTGEQNDTNLCKLFQIVRRVIADYINDPSNKDHLVVRSDGKKKLRFYVNHCANIFRDKSIKKTGVTALIPSKETLRVLREINRQLKIALKHENFSIAEDQFEEETFTPHITLCFGYSNEPSLAAINEAINETELEPETTSRDSGSISTDSDAEHKSFKSFDLDLNASYASYQRVDERGKIKFVAKADQDFCHRISSRPKMSEDGYSNTKSAARKSRKSVYQLAFEARSADSAYPSKPGKPTIYIADELEPAIYYYEYINRIESPEFSIISEREYLRNKIDISTLYEDNIDEKSCLLTYCQPFFERLKTLTLPEKTELNRLVPSILFYEYGINVIG